MHMGFHIFSTSSVDSIAGLFAFGHMAMFTFALRKPCSSTFLNEMHNLGDNFFAAKDKPGNSSIANVNFDGFRVVCHFNLRPES